MVLGGHSVGVFIGQVLSNMDQSSSAIRRSVKYSSVITKFPFPVIGGRWSVEGEED